MRLITSGESHGCGLTCILEGLPSGFKPDLTKVDSLLAIRQKTYGRGERMKIESDCVKVTGGLIEGVTYGAPLSLFIANRDDRSNLQRVKMTVPRPGHCDLSASMKYDLSDLSIPGEYCGGRITAIYTAVGEILRQFLNMFGIKILGFTLGIGRLRTKINFDDFYIDEKSEIVEKSLLRLCDTTSEDEIKIIIDSVASEGDTLGGLISVVMEGIPVGLGSFSPFYKRLDSLLSSHIMAVPGIKGVEIGLGFDSCNYKGSELQDAIYKDETIRRKTNNAGGIEAGFSNGESIVLKAVMKPLPSIKKGISSFDIESGLNCNTVYVRSDICAVPSCAVAVQSMVAIAIADAFFDKFYSDTLEEMLLDYCNYMERVKNA